LRPPSPKRPVADTASPECRRPACPGRTGKFKMHKEQRECVCYSFKQIVPRLIKQEDVISYEGALKMDLA